MSTVAIKRMFTARAAFLLALSVGAATLQAHSGTTPVFTQSSIPGTSGVRGLAVGDLNGDGIPDVVGGAQLAAGSNWVAVGMGDGHGGFTVTNFMSGDRPDGVALADMNGDGNLDIVAANSGTNAANGTTVSVLLGDGAGGFSAPMTFAVPQGPIAVATGDVNGDGCPDVAVVSNNPGTLSVLLNACDHTGNLATSFTRAISGLGTEGSVGFGDFNHDGKLDVTVTSAIGVFNSAPPVHVLFGNGNGTFGANLNIAFPTSADVETVSVADLNGDGWPDLVVSSYDTQITFCSRCTGRVAVYLNAATGSTTAPFQAPTISGVDLGANGVSVGDLDGDGSPDVVVVGYQDDTLQYLLNNGAGVLGPAVRVASALANPVGSAVADFDHNGSLDILVSTQFSVVQSFLNGPPADTTAPVISVPADLSAEATGPGGAAVTYSASATDAVDGSVAVTCVPASGSTFGLGITIVNCSAFDAHHNSASSSFNVTVVDTTPPALTLPSPITVEATGPLSTVVSYSATAFDLVSGSVTPSCTPSGSAFPISTTAVNCSATDGAGNISHGSFTVTVADHTAPVATASLLRVGHGGGDDESMQSFQIVFSATDAVGVATLTADLNGIRVTNGQIVQLQVKSGAQRAKRDDGRLQIQAPSFLLTVTATDAAGNTSSTTAVPVFVKNGKDKEDHGKGGDR